MKSTTFVQVTLAAALAVAGSVAAYAQFGGTMKANVTFPFRASSADLGSGHYTVQQENSGFTRFYLRNNETKKSAILVVHPIRTAKSERPSMTFRCVSAGCGLTEITSWDGIVYQTSQPKYSSAEKERLVTVYLDRNTSD